ncbi:tyrosine-type recombinase/integrase [Corynebacterium uterequi]|uniref:Phage integrase family protein n=1 Tax=Corynebacterium uterequi TaxID=1072256 RepID=A0A0G3HEI0_9CORY|nr:tyrosine-type recombinase/integrase [Corynebacterium uterequi]AKK11746.1 phage integrase family protein [Corynebacterium uterequi]
MARQSWGNTRQLPSGRWQARYTGPDGKTHKGPHTFPDKLTATGWLAETRRNIDLGVWVPYRANTTPPTVGELGSQWLADVARRLRDSTHRAYQDIITARVLQHPLICDTRVDRLTHQQVAAWWSDITSTYPDTMHRNKRAYSKLRAIMWTAVDQGYIAHNPVQLQNVGRGYQPAVKQLPDTADLQAIFNHMPHRYRLVAALTLFHGLRLGEALALTVEDVLDENGTIAVSVRGTLARIATPGERTRMVLHPPKTAAGYRKVPVLNEFAPVIREHLAAYRPTSWLTTTTSGNPVFDTSYRSVFNRAKARAGITKPLTPHYGRVYIITRLAEAGATPKEIGAILGQSDVSTGVTLE